MNEVSLNTIRKYIEFNAKENRSNLVILDALNVSNGPIAVAQLPHRVPYGFHGWFENRA